MGPRAISTVLGSIMIRGRAEEVAVARRFVARVLGGRPGADTAVLLTSEAVTNAVIHTYSTMIRVMVIEIPGQGLRIEISDEGGETLPAANHGCDLREGQRGVFLLQTLSVRSGYEVDASGLTYWFEL
jgi:anti-sigma regulatory factor (Ser/Thr protein kinase)